MMGLDGVEAIIIVVFEDYRAWSQNRRALEGQC
jgi:hypothetical protein